MPVDSLQVVHLLDEIFICSDFDFFVFHGYILAELWEQIKQKEYFMPLLTNRIGIFNVRFDTKKNRPLSGAEIRGNQRKFPLIEKIHGEGAIVKHLVGNVINYLPPCFQRVDNYMGKEYHIELPTPTENKVERHTVKQTMDNKMIPVFALCLCYEIRLQNVIPDNVTHNKKKNFLGHLNLAFTSALTLSASA